MERMLNGIAQFVAAGGLGNRDIEGLLPAAAFAGIGEKKRRAP